MSSAHLRIQPWHPEEVNEPTNFRLQVLPGPRAIDTKSCYILPRGPRQRRGGRFLRGMHVHTHVLLKMVLSDPLKG
jgi:hypothetical protein